MKKLRIRSIIGMTAVMALSLAFISFAYVAIYSPKSGDGYTQSSSEKYEVTIADSTEESMTETAVLERGDSLSQEIETKSLAEVDVNDSNEIHLDSKETSQENTENRTEVQEETIEDEEPVLSDGDVAQKNFTSESLKAYDGQSGMPAYIAVGGVVYDVSDIEGWSGGIHMGYRAGQDLTEAFSASPHSDSILTLGTVMGSYSDLPLGDSKAVDEAIEMTLIENLESGNIATKDVTVDGVQENTVENDQKAIAEIQLPTYTATSLKEFDGKNGRAAYIAVNGIVYDVTGVSGWSGGIHMGHEAGQDLTVAFSGSPHTESTLTPLTVVGYYASEHISDVETEQESALPAVDVVSSATQNSDNAAEQSAERSRVSAVRVFSASELLTYNGRNGNPAYIAVDGIVYDVTDEWNNGRHHGVSAGTDATGAFASSPHSGSLLSSLTQVGIMSSANQSGGVPVTVSTTHSEDEEDHYRDHEDEDEDDHYRDYEDEDEEDHYGDHENEDEDDHHKDHEDDHEEDHDDD